MIRNTKDFQVDLLCAAIEYFNDGMSRGVEYEVGWQTIDNDGTPIPKGEQKVQVWTWFGDDEEEKKPTLSQQQEWINGFLESVEGRRFLEGYLRLFRDSLLQDLDAIVSNPLRWAELDEPTKQALADYRQALLDVPHQEGFPNDIDWPTFPEEGDPNQSYVPSTVSRRQGRLALLNAGMLDDVEAAIDAIEDPAQKRAAQIEFEADTWERSNPFLQQMWSQLGGTEQQLDDLFRLGVTL